MTDIKNISSLSNPEIKRIRALSMRKYREESGVFVTEGLRHALEAAEAGWSFETLVIETGEVEKPLVQKLLSLAGKCLCLAVPPGIMESITKRDNAQSVVAVLHQKWSALPAPGNAPELWVALEEIRDPGNLGTIIRTADAVGAQGIILIGNTCDPYSHEAIRASMGSFPHVALARAGRDEFIAWAKSGDWQVVGTHLKATHDYRALSYRERVVLLMGNEQAGLTEEIGAACTDLVIIPMRGHADSLNVSVATAVMLFEINRGALALPA